MEWLKKLLEVQGLNEAQIKAIIEGVGANYTGYVPPHQFEEVNKAKKQAEADLKERDNQLTDLKKSAGDNAVLQEQITKLQSDNKAAAEKYEADVNELRLGTAIKLALSGEVHDSDIVTSLLDKSKIEIDEIGAIKRGLDDQIKSLRESKAFLFVPKPDPAQQQTTTQFKGVNPAEGSGSKSSGGQVNPWKKETYNLTEQGRILRENSDLAKQLQAAAKQ